jgi:hypothetical protein
MPSMGTAPSRTPWLVYQEETHQFYALTFAAGTRRGSMMPARSSGTRADLDPTTGLFQRSRVEHHAYAFRLHLVGGATTARVRAVPGRLRPGRGRAGRRTHDPHLVPTNGNGMKACLSDPGAWRGPGRRRRPGTDQLMYQYSSDSGHTWAPSAGPAWAPGPVPHPRPVAAQRALPRPRPTRADQRSRQAGDHWSKGGVT